MEIFGDGELEAEMHKREMKASSLSSWWQLFSDTYEELVQSIASPVRAKYSITELGDQQFSLATCMADDETFVREDFELKNVRGERLACSFWRRKTVRDVDPITELDRITSSSEEDKMSTMEDPVVDNVSTDSSDSNNCNQEQTPFQKEVDPCIIYVHGMSSSRKECVYMHRKILAAGFSLFALDLSGSGLSGGDRVSFGYFEHEDLRTVVDYLYATGRASAVIWDMLQMITKSAERRSLFFPSAMVTAVQKILTNSIGKAGGFSFRDVRLLDSAHQFMLPCLFINASKKDFFMPEHTRALCDKYGGPKSYIQFTGQIDDNRPADVVDTAISHFSERFKLLR
ncbi:hypothetical protein BBJ29_008357 [Phytophthora kernoviae]|uniref:Serine aminopeptidase S33 domain-containing protein n=1 Tax=Phytophthora kernoviae TaxID=325452 RepID=A0A3F2RDM9_9STRA|nr:hypothetical protein BBP00_00009121 [Phytophthora kernoviae]RLN71803.1 hypothetical protein BBJ29_008357 [Phytophthora kernoviae]